MDYERQLQTLRVVQNRPDLQTAITTYLRSNPSALDVGDLLNLAKAELHKDPRGELAEAIVASSALMITPTPHASSSTQDRKSVV